MIVILKNKASEASSKYAQQAWKDHISKYNYSEFNDPELRRRFQMISVLGTSALNESRLAEVRYQNESYLLTECVKDYFIDFVVNSLA